MKQSTQRGKAASGRSSRPGKKSSSNIRWMTGIAVFLLLVVSIIFAVNAQQRRGVAEAAGAEKSKGVATAPVVVEEFADFQCPACRRFFEGPARQLEQEYVGAGKVKFVFRHYAFLGEESRWAAEASECANEQGRFWDFYDRLFTAQGGENVGVFSKPNLQRFAGELGLDTVAFSQCLSSGRFAPTVQTDFEAGANRAVRGTPSVFVNGVLVDGGSDYNTLRAAIEQALQGS